MQNPFLLFWKWLQVILDGKRDNLSTNLLVIVWIKLLKYRLKVKEKFNHVKAFVHYIIVRSTGWLNSSEMESYVEVFWHWPVSKSTWGADHEL